VCSTATASSVSIWLSGLDTVLYTMHTCYRPVFALLTEMTTNEQTGTSTQKVQNVLVRSVSYFGLATRNYQYNMVAQAPSGKKPLPDMMTSIRIDSSDKVEIVDQLLLP